MQCPIHHLSLLYSSIIDKSFWYTQLLQPSGLYTQPTSDLFKGYMSEEKKPTEPPTQAKAPIKAKKSWSNPALRAMGIPRISLPSRNWMIFWTVLASIGGGIYYDKSQQTAIREKYSRQVEHLAKEIYSAERLPRKLTVFIAPPPNDFLEESLRHFRKYIKPILNAAAIDYEIYTETRQGDIRSQVAEKIRQMRREELEEQSLKEQKATQEAYDRSWTKFVKTALNRVNSVFKREAEPETLVDRHDLYEAKDVLGLYRVFEPTKPVRDDVQDPTLCGGIVCIGRGSYKEYITGVHEGLLGPLEKPEPVVETTTEQPVSIEKSVTELEGSDVNTSAGEESVVVEKAPVENNDDLQPDDEDQPKDQQPPVPAPYILASDYKNGVLAPELDFSKPILNRKGVPVLFEQPVYVFPIPKISGFLRIPEKIYNYFTTRNLAEEVSERTMIVVDGNSRKFEFKDKFMAGEEEPNWPKKWVEKGKSKNSEWVQELEVDERVTQRLRVFDNCK